MVYGRPGLAIYLLFPRSAAGGPGLSLFFRRHTTRLSYDRRRTTNGSKGHPNRSRIDLSRSPDLNVTGVAQSPVEQPDIQPRI